MMDKNEKVEFTMEGFKRVEDSLVNVPEDKRHLFLTLVCSCFVN